MAADDSVTSAVERALRTIQKLDVDLATADVRKSSVMGQTSFEEAGLTAREMYGEDGENSNANGQADVGAVHYDSKCDDAPARTGK